jgi:hypothetical protein
MPKSKIVRLLQTFTKDELKDFEKFLSSPYFSTGRNLQPLFNILKKSYPFFEDRKLSEEKIYKKLFKGKPFGGKKSLHIVKVMLSDLTSLAERFLLF